MISANNHGVEQKGPTDMVTVKIFLASSSELKTDRDEFELFIGRENKTWRDRGVAFDLVRWEDFLDVMSKTRLQDEYNRAVRECDIFVMLFATKVGQFTEEEFNAAFGQFQATGKPFILTYFKDVPLTTGTANKQDLASLWAFQEKLKSLGHYQTPFSNTDALKLHFSQQLDRLSAAGFIRFDQNDQPPEAMQGQRYTANVGGDGAIAQGTGAEAVGKGGIIVRGSNSGIINTGTHIDTGGGAYVGGGVHTGGGSFIGRDALGITGDVVGRDNMAGLSSGDLDAILAPLIGAVACHATNDEARQTAVSHVQQLKDEITKGKAADDGKMARVVNGLAALVPGAVGAVVSTFASPLLAGVAGPITASVLKRLRSN